jgi:hypothetical protein
MPVASGLLSKSIHPLTKSDFTGLAVDVKLTVNRIPYSAVISYNIFADDERVKRSRYQKEPSKVFDWVRGDGKRRGERQRNPPMISRILFWMRSKMSHGEFFVYRDGKSSYTLRESDISKAIRESRNLKRKGKNESGSTKGGSRKAKKVAYAIQRSIRKNGPKHSHVGFENDAVGVAEAAITFAMDEWSERTYKKINEDIESDIISQTLKVLTNQDG